MLVFHLLVEQKNPKAKYILFCSWPTCRIEHKLLPKDKKSTVLPAASQYVVFVLDNLWSFCVQRISSAQAGVDNPEWWDEKNCEFNFEKESISFQFTASHNLFWIGKTLQLLLLDENRIPLSMFPGRSKQKSENYFSITFLGQYNHRLKGVCHLSAGPSLTHSQQLSTLLSPTRCRPRCNARCRLGNRLVH